MLLVYEMRENVKRCRPGRGLLLPFLMISGCLLVLPAYALAYRWTGQGFEWEAGLPGRITHLASQLYNGF